MNIKHRRFIMDKKLEKDLQNKNVQALNDQEAEKVSGGGYWNYCEGNCSQCFLSDCPQKGGSNPEPV